MGCGQINRPSSYNCDTPLYGGTKPRLYLINLDDITGVTNSATTADLITAITFKTNKTAYMFEGFRNSVLPSTEKATAPSGQAVWKHIVNFFVYENSQAWKNQLKKLGNGKFIGVIQNSANDENAFEVFGLTQGLQLQDGAVNAKMENNGAYNLILVSGENQFEAKPAQTVYDGSSYATTLTLLDGYAAIPTITTVSATAIAAAGGTAETITGTYFYGGVGASDVVSVKWVNVSTGAKTTQTAVTVASNTSITFSSVALTAGQYNLEITTNHGVVTSTSIATAS